ncbi:phage head morphogenesis protein [Marinobacter subterrani]|uniref:Phage Mu protein F like protein n=1 Tax=Marinobacter subterrani TaxID=1658765 RepID=A0A0J7M7Y0_9GAMM|nr:phage minor head protein [Marinobacter subterrani]KMQ77010.1 Phage Mu protein F like protein [Marinobacter subterrani]
MAVRYGNLPFREQIEYLREKVAVPTRAWTDIYGRENDHAFMVAGANRMAIVEDFQRSVLKAIENGTTLQDFRKDFDQIVERHGWSYNGSRGWRTRVIYETNLMQSYNAGREAQMADPELRRLRPFGLYRHGGSENPRPEHLANDGKVVPLDDPWWVCGARRMAGLHLQEVHDQPAEAERRATPCWTRARRSSGRRKWWGQWPQPTHRACTEGYRPGFEHRPGADRVRSVTPPQLDGPLRGTRGPFRPASD